ncbi:permease prefix domain 1-containing protein [Deinococcus koreensis]|uniref:Uncharacterized protein n=1 Tax=Deinococcus koreensis TaxID=2054903 RepID=A0A2K3UZ10_9DEIO|nr:permease prefix domain 1-containing protein [Deinococcus koreensis]PNY81760.1 hypothetical protein CVO96_10565 [Deinococcus koreensis]
MNAVERYLRRATHGLWGQKKRDALTELRGAVEDKVYRHQLSGLSEGEAVTAALRDLGSPAVIARELGRVHTVPSLLRATLLAGMTGLLGIQAAAQLPTIQAAPVPVGQLCTFDESALARFFPEDQLRIRERIKAAGGREQYEAACRVRQPDTGLNSLLRLSDLIAALRMAQVEARTIPGTEAFVQLKVPGEDWQGLNLNEAVHFLPTGPGTAAKPGSRTEPYVYAENLISQLLYSFKGPLRLSGVVNPTLHIGPAQMQVGTTQRPVRATNLYQWAVYEEVTRLMRLDSPASAPAPRLGLSPDDGPHAGYSQLKVNAQDGAVYALVGSMNGEIGLAVRAVRAGRLELPCDCRSTPFTQTDSLKTLLAQARRGQSALMVFALDASDLRHLQLTPVPTAQLQLVSAP